jgi:hypothetical protein
MKPDVRAAFVLTLLSGILCGIGFVSVTKTAGQRRTRRPTPQRRPIQAARVDYSKFSHATKQHQAACSTCHKVPTSNWQKARGFPDIADYPDHDACVSCHRAQFFRDAKPPICSVCHSKVSPRDEARFAFRNPASRRQFLIEFPHDKHQDVIARLQRLIERPHSWTSPQIARAAFSISSQVTPPQNQSYNNCALCHATIPTPATPASGWTDGFVPDHLTFKSVPHNHSACFNCHWKSEEPVKDNCGGCHKLASGRVVIEGIERISMKFRHDGGGERKNHLAECTTCHINITKAATLRGLKPDVPITSCTECHNREGLRLDVSGELEAIDKNREFVCVYCHTSNIGKLDPPASHYLIAGREPRQRGK